MMNHGMNNSNNPKETNTPIFGRVLVSFSRLSQTVVLASLTSVRGYWIRKHKPSCILSKDGKCWLRNHQKIPLTQEEKEILEAFERIRTAITDFT